MYRSAFASSFLTDVIFWADWLGTEPSIELFDRALKECPHFELANQYVEFASTLVEEDKMVSLNIV